MTTTHTYKSYKSNMRFHTNISMKRRIKKTTKKQRANVSSTMEQRPNNQKG